MAVAVLGMAVVVLGRQVEAVLGSAEAVQLELAAQMVLVPKIRLLAEMVGVVLEILLLEMEQLQQRCHCLGIVPGMLVRLAVQQALDKVGVVGLVEVEDILQQVVDRLDYILDSRQTGCKRFQGRQELRSGRIVGSIRSARQLATVAVASGSSATLVGCCIWSCRRTW
uniref:Secreted protein n=1 Tax=Cacopsylla melanoneura TaxID=428564 RepID=A0A8D8Z807_9HEMI